MSRRKKPALYKKEIEAAELARANDEERGVPYVPLTQRMHSTSDAFKTGIRRLRIQIGIQDADRRRASRKG